MRDINKKIISSSHYLKVMCEAIRTRNGSKTIVLTTGAFDVLHDGHLKYLIAARDLGNILIVGINDDKFVRSIKGSGRPIKTAKIRAFVTAGFECVDYVYVFEDRMKIVELVKPHILVMSNSSHHGPDSEERRPQRELVEAQGGKIVVLDPMSEIHTTDFVEKIKS